MIATWVPAYIILLFSEASKAGVASVQRTSLLMFGVLYLFLGNYLPQIPHNHFLGAATPWTKQDGLIWKKTNHMFGAPSVRKVSQGVFILEFILLNGIAIPVIRFLHLFSDVLYPFGLKFLKCVTHYDTFSLAVAKCQWVTRFNC